MNKIPQFVSKYLWDTPPKISTSQNSSFIIERVLEYGDIDALNWLNKTFDRKTIVKVLKKSRRISTKTGQFYALYYGIEKKLLRCIQKPFTQKQNRF